MAESIGELLAKITLDGDEFEKALDEINKKAEGFTDGLETVGKVAGGAFAAVGAAALGAVAHLVSVSGEVTDLASRFGTGTEEFQQWSIAAGQVGASGQEVAVGIKTLAKDVTEGSESTQRALSAMGLSINDLRNQDPGQMFETVLDAVAQVADPMERTALATELLGRAGPSLIPLAGSLDDIKKRAESLGIIMSKDVTAAADDLGDSTDMLANTFGGLTNNFGAAFVTSEPLHTAIEGLTNLMGELSVWVKDNQETIRDWVDDGIMIMASAMVGGVDVIEAFAAGFKGLMDVWTLLKSEGEFVAATLNMVYEAAMAIRKGESPAVAWNEYKETLADIGETATKDIQGHQEVLDKFVGVAENVKEKFQGLANEIAKQDGVTHKSTESHKKLREAHITTAEAAKKQAENEKALGEAIEAEMKFAEEQSKMFMETLRAMGPTAQDLQNEMNQLAESFNLQTQMQQVTDEGLKNFIDRFEELRAQGVNTTDTIDEYNAAVAEAEKRGVLAGKAGRDFEKSYEDTAKAAEEAAKKVEEANKALEKYGHLGIGLASLGNMLSTGFDMANTLISGFEDFMAATSSDNRLANAFHGAQVGMQVGGDIGGAIGGPMGEAIGRGAGAIIGGIAGLFHTPEWVGVAEEAGRIFGGEVSRELAEAIMETADELDISNAEAALLHISDFMDETGASIHDMSDSVIQLFQTDFPDGSKAAQEQLDELGNAFNEVRDASNGVGDAMTVMMIQMARQTGLMTDEMESFIKEQNKLIVEGAAQIAEGFAQLDPSSWFVRQLEDGSFSKVGENAASFFAMGFQQAIADQGVLGALDSMGDDMMAMFEQLSAAGNTAAADILAPFVELDNKLGDDGNARGMLEILEGMGKVFEGQANQGFASADMFQAMSDQLAATFNELTTGENPLGDPAAMQAIMPELAKVIQASQNLGIPLDEKTAEMKAAAEAMGFTFPVEPMQQLVDLMSTLVTGMGFDLPSSVTTSQTSFQTFGTESSNSLGTVSSNIDKMGSSFDTVTDTSVASAKETSATWGESTNQISDLVETSAQQSSEAFLDFGQTATDIGDWVGVAWNGNIGEIGMTALNQVAPVEEAFTTLQDVALEPLEDVASAVGRIVGGLYQIPGAADAAGTAMAGMEGPKPGSGAETPNVDGSFAVGTDGWRVAPRDNFTIQLHRGEPFNVVPAGQAGGETNSTMVGAGAIQISLQTNGSTQDLYDLAAKLDDILTNNIGGAGQRVKETANAS